MSFKYSIYKSIGLNVSNMYRNSKGIFSMPSTINILPTKTDTIDIFPLLAQTPNRLNFSRRVHGAQIESDIYLNYKNVYMKTVNTRTIFNDALITEFRNMLQPNNPYVDLSNNKFGKKFVMLYHLLDSFNNEHTCTNYLNLSHNQLYKFIDDEADDVVGLMEGENLALTYLDLSYNGFGIPKKNSGRVRFQENFVSLIPPQTTHLSLANNKLIYVNVDSLTEGFDNLPNTLTYLDLSNNYIQYDLPDNPIYTPYKVKNAFSHLPTTLTHLNFSGNFHPATTDEQLIPFLKKLPVTLETITIAPGRTIDLAAWRTLERLLFLVETKILEKEQIDKFSLGKKELQIPVELNEYRLNQFITILEKMNTPLSLLLCSFLLEGRIPNNVENKEDLSAYMEKRTHDAIGFYEKILMYPTQEEQAIKCIKPLVEFLLWEIKTLSDTPSVINRLRAYSISPNAILGKIYSSNILTHTNENRVSAQITLYNDARFFSSNKRSNPFSEEHLPQAKKRAKVDMREQMDEEIQSQQLPSFFDQPQNDENMTTEEGNPYNLSM